MLSRTKIRYKMKKENILVFVFIFGLLWISLTYFIFISRHSPLGSNAGDVQTSQRERSLKRKIESFEVKLRDQLDSNKELYGEVQHLLEERQGQGQKVDPKVAAPEGKFNDAADEYVNKPDDFKDDIVGADLTAGLKRHSKNAENERAINPKFVRGRGVNPPEVDEEMDEEVGLDSPLNNEGDLVMPVLMFACNRVSVNRAVDLILKYRGDNVQKYPLIVSQDCNHAQTRAVLEGYRDKIIYIQQPNQAEPVVPKKEAKFKGYFKIARHYGWALNHTFNVLGYDQVIVVEDDLEVSPDFFSYFEATLPILKSDPSLYCVSAWNDNGKAGLIDETRPELLYRTDFFGGLGWMLTKELWQGELMTKWPRSYWDDWFRDPKQRKDRACIRPEISRTKTFGKIGVSNGLFYDKHLKFIKLNSEHPVDFQQRDLFYLKKDVYDGRMTSRLNNIPVTSIEELKSGEAKAKYGQGGHGAVRLVYHTKLVFKKIAKVLGIMDDFKSGVPRMAYKGVVSTMYNGLRVFVAPNNNWKGYDPTW